MGELFCGWVLTGVRVETLSKQGFEGLCSVFEGMSEAGGDGGVVICSAFAIHCCCCCWQTIVADTVSLVFSGLGATGMWCWQSVLSAVWRMTLVAMALQGWAGVFSAMGVRTG